MLDDRTGLPLDVGRRTRSIPPAIRRALKVRDGGRCFPGCAQTRWVDGHHIRHWADGGETKLDNLVLLCRFHHRLVHEGGFELYRDAHGDIRIQSPDGRALRARTPPQPAEPDSQVPADFPAASYTAGETGNGRVFRVEPEDSEIRIYVFRAGALARLGHNHIVSGHALNGFIFLAEDVRDSRFDLYVPAHRLEVDKPGVLDAGRFHPYPRPCAGRDA